MLGPAHARIKAILGPASAGPRVILGHAPDMTQHPIESYTRQDSKLFWVLHTSGSKAIVGSTPGRTWRYFGSCTQQDLKLYKKNGILLRDNLLKKRGL